MVTKKNNEDENKILNRYLLFGWGVIAIILVITYGVEVIKGAFKPHYYIPFLAVTVLPLLACGVLYKKDPSNRNLRYWIFAGYSLMYGFALLTGHTSLVFTYIFPLMSLIILYHDSFLVLQVGALTLLLNIAYIVRDFHNGKITVINSRDYEIQIALILLCFFGCYLATRVYDRISEMNKEKELEVLRLQEERIILEERNKYALIDVLTDLGNRRKYDESLDELKENPVENLNIVMVDINGLKRANDTIGHVAGDELIVGMAHCIKTAFDGELDEGFRFGGDEFAIISCCETEEFKQKIKRLRENISLWKGVHINSLHAAIGYIKVDNGVEIADALKIADRQMYEDKERYYAQSEFDRRRR